MKRLNQAINTTDDSFSYTLQGESEPIYRVERDGKLFERGKRIGKFQLADKHWELFIGDKLIECSPEGTLFGLPEFELASLTRLINKKED